MRVNAVCGEGRLREREGEGVQLYKIGCVCEDGRGVYLPMTGLSWKMIR